MEKNDSIKDTIVVIEHDVHNVTDSALIVEIEHRGERIVEAFDKGHYSDVAVKIIILLFVVVVVWKKRKHG
jgi:hypothetical protein